MRLIRTAAWTRDCPGGTVNGVSGVQPGYYALGPDQIKAMDPLGIGISPAVLSLLQAVSGVQRKCRRWFQHTRLSLLLERRFQLQHLHYATRLPHHFQRLGNACLCAERRKTSSNRDSNSFPARAASTTLLDDSKGITIGLTSLITPRLINDFHWGFVRQGGQIAGVSQDPAVFLNGIDSLVPFTRSTIVPLCPSTSSPTALNWTRKNHTFQFGTDLFLIRNNHTSYANSFSDVRTNAVYLNTGGIAGTSSPLDPANNGYPAVDGNFGPNYDSAATIVDGNFSRG